MSDKGLRLADFDHAHHSEVLMVRDVAVVNGTAGEVLERHPYLHPPLRGDIDASIFVKRWRVCRIAGPVLSCVPNVTWLAYSQAPEAA
jgi:hypothetical protein